MHCLTFRCDQCESEFTIEQDMEIPPYWLGVQIALSNGDGYIPMSEQDNINHFCSKECLIDYINGEDMKRRIATVDKEEE